MTTPSPSLDAQRAPSRPSRPPRGWVVWDPSPEERDADVDWSPWYLTDEDDMGESGEQHHINTQLASALVVLARERGWTDVHVGSDQFFAWREDEPLVRVSPDVYLLDDPPSPPLPDMWETWRPEHGPPRFAVEVVSRREWRKDYEGNPPKYAQLGTRELAVFDPWAASGVATAAGRLPLQLFRRAADGAFVRVHAGPGPARSEELDAWLVVRRWVGRATLRVARDPDGADLVPTEGEALQAKDRDLQAKDRDIQAKDRDIQAKDRALRDALAELERLRGKREDDSA